MIASPNAAESHVVMKDLSTKGQTQRAGMVMTHPACNTACWAGKSTGGKKLPHCLLPCIARQKKYQIILEVKIAIPPYQAVQVRQWLLLSAIASMKKGVSMIMTFVTLLVASLLPLDTQGV